MPQPHLDKAADGFGLCYWRLLLGRPRVNRLDLNLLKADAN